MIKSNLAELLIILIFTLLTSCVDQNNKEQAMDIDKFMENFKNRTKYKSLSKETLQNIPDDKLLQAIVDYIIEEIIQNDYENEYEIVKKQSSGIQYIWAIWGLEAEVNNGGFNQYFYNSSGQFAKEAHIGCIAIGANNTSEILKGAITTLSKEIDLHKRTKETGTLEDFMDSYNETQLGQWDDKFYESPDDLSGLMIKYIRNNYDQFITE